MSEDTMNRTGRHADYDTAELDPVDGRPGPFGGDADGAGAAHAATFAEDVNLTSDPFADDLTDRLAARAPRRYVTRTTTVLAALALVAGGFLAGAQVQKHTGTTAASAAAPGAGAFAGGGFGGQRQGGNGQAGNSQSGGAPTGGQGTAAAGAVTTGTVKLVDGTTVYVQTADGNVVTVKTTGSTAVQVTQDGALRDLSPGTQVSVEGQAASDGTVNATKVVKGR
jgi:hypothetical protein